MSARWRVPLGYLALVVLVVTTVNDAWWITEDPAPVSVVVSLPLSLLAGGYLAYGFVFPSMFGRLHRRRTVLPPPGQPIATAQCGGRIGPMRFSNPQITVTAYTDRLTLRVWPMGECTIHGSEISSLAGDDRPWQVIPRLVIEHRGPGWTSPVVLALPVDHPLPWAISQIRREPLPAAALVAQDDATLDAERGVVSTYKSMTFIVGIDTGIGLAGLGVVGLAQTHSPFLVGVMALRCLARSGQHAS